VMSASTGESIVVESTYRQTCPAAWGVEAEAEAEAAALSYGWPLRTDRTAGA
jgi:hypothetical protein